MHKLPGQARRQKTIWNIEMNSDTLNIISGLVGIIIGVVLQYSLSALRDRQRSRENLETNAYVDYVRAVARWAIEQKAQRPDDEIINTAKSDTLDAKIRIGIHGHSSVILRVARFHREFSHLNDEAARASFRESLMAMRHRAAPDKSGLDHSDIDALIFG